MELLVTSLWIFSITVIILFFVGWFFFRIHSWLFRSLEKAIQSTVDHSKEIIGDTHGVCNGCGADIYLDEGIWRHDDKANEIYVSCHNCGYKKVGVSVEIDDLCPACGAAFPSIATIIHAASPKLRLGINLKNNYYALRLYLSREAKYLMDYLYDYYNTQKRNTIPDWYYHIACYLWRKHNVVKCRDLDPLFHEPSELMPEVMFELLRQHVEEDPDILTYPDAFEESEYYQDWGEEDKRHIIECDKAHHNRRVEIKNLYLWWTKTRLEQQRELDEFLDKCYGEESRKYSRKELDKMKKHYMKMEDKQEKDLEHAMIRLVKVHGALWT